MFCICNQILFINLQTFFFFFTCLAVQSPNSWLVLVHFITLEIKVCTALWDAVFCIMCSVFYTFLCKLCILSLVLFLRNVWCCVSKFKFKCHYHHVLHQNCEWNDHTFSVWWQHLLQLWDSNVHSSLLQNCTTFPMSKVSCLGWDMLPFHFKVFQKAQLLPDVIVMTSVSWAEIDCY